MNGRHFLFNGQHKLSLTPLAAALLACLPPAAFAAEEQVKVMEEVVVTGTPGGSEISKLEASFAITTVSEQDIRQFSPKSTADLIKTVPGVWVESSGGVSGANIFVRGFPGSGDAEFVSMQINGAPIYPPPTLSFLENSTLFRIDETIERMEGLRGGPNPVFSNGQPGLTTNFILKEGGDESEGVLKYTTSDYDLQRVDAMISGALQNDLYYMIGGYASTSPGIRDAGFNAEEGQQLTINLTKTLTDGKLNLFARTTDDHGTWYLPAPLKVPGVDGEFTYVGTLNRNTTVGFGPDDEQQAFDFGEGRGWDGTVYGGRLELDLGNGWSFVDRFSYTKGDANTFGLVPDGAAVQLSDLGLASATTLVTGTTLGADDWVQRVGFWVVMKEIESFTNDFSLAKEWDGAKVTGGYYTATSSADDWWALGNGDDYLHVRDGGEMTDINCMDPGLLITDCGFNYDINGNGDTRNRAYYLAGEWDINDAWRLDLGVRHETHEVEYSVDEGLDGVITKSVDGYDESEVSWTLGANWSLSENAGLFARFNTGYKFPYFDDFRDNFGVFESGGDLIKEVDQYEFGYKYATDNLGLYVTAFFNTVDGSQFVTQPGAPVEVSENEAYGVEIDLDYYNNAGFSVSLNATVQKTEVEKSSTPANEGNDVIRQPDWQVRITPSYDFEFKNGFKGTVYGTVTAVDDRFSDPANIQTLDSYEKFDLGVIINATDKLSFQLAVDNVTDDDGLTEGDPRATFAANARTILPRSTKFSIGYEF